EPDGDLRRHIVECIDGDDLQITTVNDGAAARQMLTERRIDCVVLGAERADQAEGLEPAAWNGGSVLARPPIIVYGRDGTSDRPRTLAHRLAGSCTVHAAHAPDRLLDLTTYYLHRPVERMPQDQRRLVTELHESNRLLAGRRVLIVDDDMRNIFALSTVLE